LALEQCLKLDRWKDADIQNIVADATRVADDEEDGEITMALYRIAVKLVPRRISAGAVITEAERVSATIFLGNASYTSMPCKPTWSLPRLSSKS
jgi:hypothetical protein